MAQESVFGDIDTEFEDMFSESVMAAEDEEGKLPEASIAEDQVVQSPKLAEPEPEEYYEETTVEPQAVEFEEPYVEEVVYEEPEPQQPVQQVYEQPVPFQQQPEPVYIQEPEPEPVYEPELVVKEQEEYQDEGYEEDGSFDANGSQAMNLKEGIDYNVSIETIDEIVKILDAYRSLEDDEREFAGRFMGLDVDTPESSVISAVLNADPLLFEVFPSLLEAKEQDDTEMAFYVVSRRRDVLEGMSFVAAQYLENDPADSKNEKVSYAREIVHQIKQLDERALRLIRAANSLVHGEALTEDDEYRE